MYVCDLAATTSYPTAYFDVRPSINEILTLNFNDVSSRFKDLNSVNTAVLLVGRKKLS